MTFPRRQVAVAGVYLTKQGKLPDRTSFSLQLEAIKGALDDAGMTVDDVDGLLPMSGLQPPRRPRRGHRRPPVLGGAARRPARSA